MLIEYTERMLNYNLRYVRNEIPKKPVLQKKLVRCEIKSDKKKVPFFYQSATEPLWPL